MRHLPPAAHSPFKSTIPPIDNSDTLRYSQIHAKDVYKRQLQTRLTEIEKETAKIPGMSESIKDLSKQVGRINRLRWQMAGAATATGVLGLSAGFFIKAFLHFNWLEHIIR